jgi:NAD(P)-dependent dehydrogenase (short-subunit alcohol dehydrogenase family)
VRRLEDKRAIVTGASAGIGRAIALRLGAEGARVAIADLDEEGAKKVAAELEGDSLVHQADVTQEQEVEALVRRVVEEWDGLDVMVNNAGVGVAANTPETTEEDWDVVLNVCLKGTFFGMKYAIPAIRRSGGGSVINMSSIAALVGVADRAAYSACEGRHPLAHAGGGDRSRRRGSARQLHRPRHGRHPVGGAHHRRLRDPEDAREKMKARQPHGRLVSPEEIAAMAAYLASDEADSVVGACMVVDGGMTAR